MQNMNLSEDDKKDFITWNVVDGCDFYNCSRIFPTQQRDVQNLLDLWRNDSNIKRVIIFGSSVTTACNPWSDIDVFVDIKEPVDVLKKPECVVNFDIWTNFDVDSRLMSEISDKGVVVYERWNFVTDKLVRKLLLDNGSSEDALTLPKIIVKNFEEIVDD